MGTCELCGALEPCERCGGSMNDTIYVCNGCGKASDKPRPACPKCGETRWVKLVIQDK